MCRRQIHFFPSSFFIVCVLCVCVCGVCVCVCVCVCDVCVWTIDQGDLRQMIYASMHRTWGCLQVDSRRSRFNDRGSNPEPDRLLSHHNPRKAIGELQARCAGWHKLNMTTATVSLSQLSDSLDFSTILAPHCYEAYFFFVLRVIDLPTSPHYFLFLFDSAHTHTHTHVHANTHKLLTLLIQRQKPPMFDNCSILQTLIDAKDRIGRVGGGGDGGGGGGISATTLLGKRLQSHCSGSSEDSTPYWLMAWRTGWAVRSTGVVLHKDKKTVNNSFIPQCTCRHPRSWLYFIMALFLFTLKRMWGCDCDFELTKGSPETLILKDYRKLQRGSAQVLLVVCLFDKGRSQERTLGANTTYA